MEPIMVKGFINCDEKPSGGDQGGHCVPRPAESVLIYPSSQIASKLP